MIQGKRYARLAFFSSISIAGYIFLYATDFNGLYSPWTFWMRIIMKKLSMLIFPSLVGFLAVVINLAATLQEQQGPRYAGAKQCRKCHIDRHKTWSKDLHSKAFDNIKADYQKDPECLKCHTTGYGEGGFTSLEQTPALTGVQCEQCHGPGHEHIPLMSKLKKEKVDKEKYPEDMKINKRPTICIKCHSPHREHVPFEK